MRGFERLRYFLLIAKAGNSLRIGCIGGALFDIQYILYAGFHDGGMAAADTTTVTGK